MTDPNLVGGGGADAAELSRIDDSGTGPQKPRSLWNDAWRQLRRKPAFVISAVIILLIVLIAIAPGLFSSREAGFSDLTHANEGPSADAWFGYDNQGYDVYARTIYGARASLLVGVFSTLLTVLFGSLVGIFAGYYGRFVDSVLSRFGDIFAGLPFVLGAIVILTTFNAPGSNPGAVTIIVQVVCSIAVLSWPVAMRIMRSATLVAKQLDYVKAARGLGASTPRIIFRHLLPNTVAPVLVYATIALGAFIGAEATLAYLGIGVRPPVISWGVMISDSRDYFRVDPHMLLFPGAFVTLTVLAFVMLGDGIRDALDPKSR
ncbi:Dipeptide transport system permease protein DppC (TC 3.A.1.5.2) [Amycolatopsis camponoti]|uniref:Dipeptide transport system permease protein DppC (TC 3.A.1.5.2) n=1 Tax=Amycolatopsis camponoti TaxID=2606593 RepID=A0A6I8LHE1_9PSEU|nr:ABC transporter permease [Amycolatopsis camponoti]VVJ15447.1 Dipeptide transport system permease protein DppC (TC 3.A.1.5.2) [Amycolatopsis camponoti]